MFENLQVERREYEEMFSPLEFDRSWSNWLMSDYTFCKMAKKSYGENNNNNCAAAEIDTNSKTY